MWVGSNRKKLSQTQSKTVILIKSELVSWIKSEPASKVKSEPVTRVKLTMPITGLTSDIWLINGRAPDASAECSRQLWGCRRRSGPFLDRIPLNEAKEWVSGSVIVTIVLVNEGVWVIWYSRYTIWTSVHMEYSSVWVHVHDLVQPKMPSTVRMKSLTMISGTLHILHHYRSNLAHILAF